MINVVQITGRARSWSRFDQAKQLLQRAEAADADADAAAHANQDDEVVYKSRCLVSRPSAF